ncbi:MAG TPA: ATP-binding protein, partial [Gemmatimonadaceae bacterium]
MTDVPLPINLDALLERRTIEGERVEYKAGWNPERALHTISAFANDFHNLGGGYLVIGVEEENGRPALPPTGIDPDSIDAIQKELLKLGHHAIQPAFHPIAAPYTVGGNTVLVIWAPGGETRPYKAMVSLGKNATEWGYYIRRGSSTVRAKGADERELLGLAASVPFDDRFNQSASVDDLSRRLIGEFLDEVGSELADEAPSLPMEALGRQMNVVGGPSEFPFPRNVGLLFFNEEPFRFFPATQIDVVYF